MNSIDEWYREYERTQNDMWATTRPYPTAKDMSEQIKTLQAAIKKTREEVLKEVTGLTDERLLGIEDSALILELVARGYSVSKMEKE